MLRELQVTMNKPANAMYKAGEKVMTGMAVVKNESNGTFELPSAATAADIFFVDKERIPTGINASRENMSDYDENFTVVEDGEMAKVIAYYVGERFATDQYADGLTVGDRLEAGEDGKLAKATGVSRYIYKGVFDDAGHKLAIVEVSDTAK